MNINLQELNYKEEIVVDEVISYDSDFLKKETDKEKNHG